MVRQGDDMRYLLDTNICIALIKDLPGVREKIIQAGIENCIVPDIARTLLRRSKERTT